MVCRALGYPQVPPAGWARDAGQGWHFGGGQGKQGSLCHCRGAESMAEAEGRHWTQKALLGLRENLLRSHPARQSRLGRTTAPHPRHMQIPELGGCCLLYRHQKSHGLSHRPHPLLLSITSKPDDRPQRAWPRAGKGATAEGWTGQAGGTFVARSQLYM